MRTYKINPHFIINLDSSDEKVLNFFDTKYADLYDGEPNSLLSMEINLLEKENLKPQKYNVLRDITIPEFCIFDENSFLIVKDKKCMHIPFSRIGVDQSITVSYEVGFPLDWIRRLIEDIIDFHLIGFNAVFLHGACLIYDDIEIIIPAWRGTGKTNFTLNLIAKEEYSYKAEDQFFLFSNQESYLFTDATHVDYKTITHFPSLKKYNLISFWLRNLIARITLPLIPASGIFFEFLRRGVIKLLAPKVFLKLKEFIPIKITHNQVPRKLVLKLVAQPDLKKPIFHEIELEKMAKMLIGGMEFERMDLWPYYYAWCFAMGEDNENFSKYFEKTLRILHDALSSAKFFEIRTPYGFNWSENFIEVQEIINQVAH